MKQRGMIGIFFMMLLSSSGFVFAGSEITMEFHIGAPLETEVENYVPEKTTGYYFGYVVFY